MAIAVSSLQPYVQPADRAIYVRRRLVAMMLCLAALVLGCMLVQKVAAVLPDVPASGAEHRLEAAVQPGDISAGPAAGQPYVVQPGDSMWSIATRVVPYGETSSFVDRMVELNGGPTLAVGQRLVLPSP